MMLHVPGLRALAPLQVTTDFLYLRGERTEDAQPVVVKTHPSDEPGADFLARLSHEHALLRRLASPRSLEPINIIEEPHRVALVLRGIDALPLDHVIATLPPGPLLATQLSLQLARGLKDLHGAGVAHCALSAENVLVDLSAGDARFHDLGVATPLGDPPTELLARSTGTSLVACLPPEFVRMVIHRSHDGVRSDDRADLYSLGCVIYELLSGRRPFLASEPRGLLHAHLTEVPQPLHAIAPSIPIGLSALVMKLLEKAPERRYQSADGVCRDLEYCESCLSRGESPAKSFVPGRHDVDRPLELAEGVYGRDGERQQLVDAFKPESRAQSRLVLVFGRSGIGKTSFVETTLSGHEFSAARKLSGKFDQVSRSTPHAAMAAMFSGLVIEMLDSNSDQREEYRRQLVARAGDSLAMLSDLLPGIQELVGAQEQSDNTPPELAARRMRHHVRELLKLFATPTRPLALFVDDIQWANHDALTVLFDIATDPDLAHVFVVAACREDASAQSGTLTAWLDSIAELDAQTLEAAPGAAGPERDR